MSERPTTVLLGLSWSVDSVEVRRRVGDAEPALEPLTGLALNYVASVDSARFCVGHVPFRSAHSDYVSCRRLPEPGGRTCRSCGAAEAVFASNLHHSHTRELADLDPSIAAHLQQPNVLYLAAFRDGSVKVGTSTEKRYERRLAEQGAWRAVIVARAEDGRIVRTIEDQVTEVLGLSQSVSINRKLDGMVQPLGDDMLERRVSGLVDSVHDLIARLADKRLEPEHQPWEFPDGIVDPAQRLHRYPLRLDSGSHDIEVVGACGRVAVLARPQSSDVFVADIGQVFGVELELGDHEADALAVQDSLF